MPLSQRGRCGVAPRGFLTIYSRDVGWARTATRLYHVCSGCGIRVRLQSWLAEAPWYLDIAIVLTTSGVKGLHRRGLVDRDAAGAVESGVWQYD